VGDVFFEGAFFALLLCFSLFLGPSPLPSRATRLSGGVRLEHHMTVIAQPAWVSFS
jgi:hypothetical protein